MLILQTYKFLDDLIDFGAFCRNDGWVGFRAPFVSMTLILWFLFSVLDFVSNIGNLNDLGPSLVMMSEHMMTMTIYFHFLFNHDRFISLLGDLQSIVNESKCAS